ncbi:MAG: amidohydrolase family protein [Candidatus Cloacimonetes bacterium]|nr:amidohydrolase family protein [Candidatus Cloacimonadota bacterium]
MDKTENSGTEKGFTKSQKNKVDIIINCGILLCIAPENEVLKDKSVVIDKSKIIDILDFEECSGKYISTQTISAEKQIVMPGFINTHTHIGMSYFKGLGDDLPLGKWLNEHIWPAESEHISPEFIYDSALHGIAEHIKNGMTMFNDMYFINQETAKACNKTGIRAVLGGGLILDFPMGRFHKPEEYVSNLYKLIDFVSDIPLINLSISPHSVYTVSQSSWELAIKTAQKENLIIHTHLCETEKEVNDCKEKYGKNPVEFLHGLGAFETKFIFAHGIYIEDSDFELIKEKDCSVAINLHSNLKLASGIPPINKYIKNNMTISFGTDGVASNNTLSISDEIATAAKLYKAIYRDPSFLPAKELVKMATLNGAKALGKEDMIGSIEIGKKADIISIDINNFQCQPVYDPFSYIVYSMNRQNISNVVIDGKIVMKDKKMLTIDEEELLENVIKYKGVIRG